MSGVCTGWVLEHSPVTGAARLVLVVLADRADQEGRNAYPSVSSIAHAARCSESSVHRVLRELEAGGHIVREGVSRYRTTNYRVAMTSQPADQPSGPRTLPQSDPPNVGPSELTPGPSDPGTSDPPTIGPDTSKEREMNQTPQPPQVGEQKKRRGLRANGENPRALARVPTPYERWVAWAEETMPSLPPGFVAQAALRIEGLKQEVTPESVTARLAATWPHVLEPSEAAGLTNHNQEAA